MQASALELSDYLNSATVTSSAAQFETNLSNNTDDVQMTPNAELTIRKQVINDNGGNASLTDFSLTSDAGALVFDAGVTVGDTTTYTADTLFNAPGTYSMSEADVAGYTEGSWSCVDVDDNPLPMNDDVFDAGSLPLEFGGIRMQATCTIINDDNPASLIVVKDVVNDNGGNAVVADFGITTTAGALVFDAGTTIGDTTTYTATALTVDANTAFDLAEIDLAGYTEGAWSCDNGDGGAFDAGSVTLDEGEVVTCTISNDDRGVDLSIIKTVDDGTPDIGDIVTFSLQIDNAGPDEASDVSVTDLLPAGFTYGATIPVVGVTETGTAPNLAWMISAIPSGGSVTIQYTATVLAP